MFVMQKQNHPDPVNGLQPLLLDIRPIFNRGASPCGYIDQAVASLQPRQDLILIAPFEPLPLFTKLTAQGFEHQSNAMPDGSWRIRFVRTHTGAPAASVSCGS
jgi:hypothetical protein